MALQSRHVPSIGTSRDCTPGDTRLNVMLISEIKSNLVHRDARMAFSYAAKPALQERASDQRAPWAKKPSGQDAISLDYPLHIAKADEDDEGDEEHEPH